jgi:hypothetical protein
MWSSGAALPKSLVTVMAVSVQHQSWAGAYERGSMSRVGWQPAACVLSLYTGASPLVQRDGFWRFLVRLRAGTP